ncbi:hypothetical protein, partial [Thermincola ferriacetica]
PSTKSQLITLLYSGFLLPRRTVQRYSFETVFFIVQWAFAIFKHAGTPSLSGCGFAGAVAP